MPIYSTIALRYKLYKVEEKINILFFPLGRYTKYAFK